MTLGRPAERPQVQNGSLRMHLPPWTKLSSLTCRLSSPALSYALRRESLLCTHVPSPPPEAGGLNLTLSLCARRALSGELRARVGAGLRDQGVRDPERGRGGFPPLDASSCPPTPLSPTPPPPALRLGLAEVRCPGRGAATAGKQGRRGGAERRGQLGVQREPVAPARRP